MCNPILLFMVDSISFTRIPVSQHISGEIQAYGHGYHTGVERLYPHHTSPCLEIPLLCLFPPPTTWTWGLGFRRHFWYLSLAFPNVQIFQKVSNIPLGNDFFKDPYPSGKSNFAPSISLNVLDFGTSPLEAGDIKLHNFSICPIRNSRIFFAVSCL